jgi:hypothetical protein
LIAINSIDLQIVSLGSESKGDEIQRRFLNDPSWRSQCIPNFQAKEPEKPARMSTLSAKGVIPRC